MSSIKNLAVQGSFGRMAGVSDYCSVSAQCKKYQEEVKSSKVKKLYGKVTAAEG